MEKREQWGSRIGLILAMAGNAVGLGNFLRFPVQAAQNGGGAFMIPYFIAFIVMAIPLMWVEWAIGRRGGRYGAGSTIGMLDALWRNPIAKYLGVIGTFTSFVILTYYVYIVSWTLGYSFYSALGFTGIEHNFTGLSTFLKDYLGGSDYSFLDFHPSYIFLLITIVMNFYILLKGLSGGIEKLAKYGMPILFVFGIFIAVWVLTIGTPDPIAHPERSVWSGLAFIWNPDFSKLTESSIWLAASGQVFFTLSLGMGTLHAYASYLDSKQDIALNGLATASVNEFAEVVIGGTIAIPIAVAFFGLTNTQQIAQNGTFDLGFISMPVIFSQVPVLGNVLGVMWFLLLFIAGITSSVSMAQPLVSFLKEEFKFSHKKSVITISLITITLLHLVVFFHAKGFMDEMDFWGGTFALVLFAFIEIVLFAWGLGIDKAWKEINLGAEIKIPAFFKFIIKYVTPTYIGGLLIFWTIDQAIPVLTMQGVAEDQLLIRWLSRIMMCGMILVLIIIVKVAWTRNKRDYDKIFNEEI